MTTVGTVEYDVRLNLGQLKKDTAQAERIVNNSYKKMSKSQTRSTSGGSSGAKTQAEEITKTTKAQVESTKMAAQESYNAIAKYTPQIQRQFLAVERANNQVFNASSRSAAAIEKFGAGSVQAQRATGALSVAVQNQSMAQQRLQSSLSRTEATYVSTGNSAKALMGVLIGLGAAIATNLGKGIARMDTLNNFPKTMANFGLAAEDGEEAIRALADGLVGLPTSLDQGARAVQRFTAVNNDVKASTALFLAFNNAVIAGGAGMEIQATALEQLSQAYAKGRVDMIEWRALLTAMPAQLNQIAASMGITTDALGEGLRKGEISVDDFLMTIAKLNSEGVNGLGTFKQQAMNQVDGVQVTITNLNTAIARSIEGMLNTIGKDQIKTIIGGIADGFENFGRGVSFVTKVVQTLGAPLTLAVVGLTGVAVAMARVTGATTLASRAIAVFRGALTLLSKHPVIFALTAIIAGLTAVGAAMGVFGSNTDESAESAKDLQDALDSYEPPLRGANEEAGKFAKQMAKIDKQIREANEDYRYSLAQLVADKNENIASLQAALGDEEKAYNNAYQERLSSFNKSQDEEEKTHQEKTRALQNQIDFLTRYNNQANNRRRVELEFELARENAEYQKSTLLRQTEFQAQTKSAQDEYEKRRAENQKKLNEELALLNKHRNDVLSVRGVMLRDDIENLKYSRTKQLEALEQQKKDAIDSNASQNDALLKQNKKYLDAVKKQASGSLSTTGPGWGGATPDFQTGDFLSDYGRSIAKYGPGALFGKGWAWADGGYTGRGGKYDPAGIVHKGEYVVPKEQVNQSTGLPEFSKMGGNTNVTVNLSLSGVMTSSKADERAIASRMAKLINETVTAKTGKPAIAGV